MRQLTGSAALVLAFALFLSGCAAPDHVATYRSPIDGVFYTVETFYGRGAADDDYSRVYANFTYGGQTDRQLVLGGEYLEVSRIEWINGHDVVLCVHSVTTGSFLSEVHLVAGPVAVTVRNHLQQNCH